MARDDVSIIDIFGGISIANKVGPKGSFRFGKHLNIYDDPNDLTLNVTGEKVSGTAVLGLIKWIEDGTPYDENRYAYDADGRLYKEDSGGHWSVIRTVANSKGQGLAIHGDYLYYTQNEQIGRYGPLSSAPTFDDAWQTGLNDTAATGFAPIMTFKEGFAVGHGNKIAWWDGAVWSADSLILPAELNVRSLTKTDQYIVLGAWRGSAITASEDGYIFTWDSLSDTFNDFYPTDGGLNAMTYTRNRLLSIQGHQGYIYTDSAPFNKQHQIPRVTNREFVDVYPGAMTIWKNLVLFGVSDSSSTADFRGVYSYGAKSQLFPDALNYAFSISTGNSATTVQIGAVKGFGDELYIAWRDGTTFGVDKIDNNSHYATSGVYESLIEDSQRPKDDKKAIIIEIGHLPLASGESIAVAYRKNRATDWTTLKTNSVEGSTETKATIPAPKQRYREFEWQTTLIGPGTSTPTVTQQDLTLDDLKEERRE